MNNGESANVIFYAENGTKKILFNNAKIYKGTASASAATATYSGITVNKLPYSVSGLTISDIKFNNTKVTITVKNNTGYPITGISSIEYKCYNGSGTVLKSGSCYLEDMNNGESANVIFYAENGTKKILFNNAKIYKGTASASAATATYSGITVNKLPYSVSGLTISDIKFNNTKVTITVKNNTGYPITGISSIEYKCYNGSGTVLKSGNCYLEDMNNGESAYITFYAENGTKKILFNNAKIYKGTASAPVATATYSGITVNKLPYSVSGLTISDIKFNNNKVTITVKNNTGYPISGLSSIEYKCYNGSGTVLKSGSCYLEDMKKGESCIATFYVESGTKKIIFGNAKIYK